VFRENVPLKTHGNVSHNTARIVGVVIAEPIVHSVQISVQIYISQFIIQKFFADTNSSKTLQNKVQDPTRKGTERKETRSRIIVKIISHLFPESVRLGALRMTAQEC
jgi:hypothetical protein